MIKLKHKGICIKNECGNFVPLTKHQKSILYSVHKETKELNILLFSELSKSFNEFLEEIKKHYNLNELNRAQKFTLFQIWINKKLPKN